MQVALQRYIQRTQAQRLDDSNELSFYLSLMLKHWWWVVLGGSLAWGCGPKLLSSRGHTTPKHEGPRACRQPQQRVVDLTHPLHNDMVFAPGGLGFKQTRTLDYEQGFRQHKVELGDDVGTHLAAPSQYVEGKRGIEQLAPRELVVPVVLLDVSEKVAENADYVIDGDDIVDWEAINGPVPIESVFIVNTGWHKRFGDPEKYKNQDDRGVMHFPGFSKAAAQLLVERDVVGIGIDTLSVDPGQSTDAAAHKVMFGANKYLIENLANLDELPESGATLIVGVLAMSEATQAPARILALVPVLAPGPVEEPE